MLTECLVSTERAACATGPVVGFCLPFVRMTIWAFSAQPPSLFATLSFDDSVAYMCIFGGMPVAVQVWAEATEFWPV